MRVGCHSEELIQGRLARAMVAQGNLADPDDAIDMNNIASHSSGHGRRGEVISARQAIGAEALVEEPPGSRQQVGGMARGIISAQHADHRGDAAASEPAHAHRGDPSPRASFPTTTGNVDVGIHETRDGPPTTEVPIAHAEARRKRRIVRANPHDRAARNQNMTQAERLGGVDLEVAKKLHRGVAGFGHGAGSIVEKFGEGERVLATAQSPHQPGVDREIHGQHQETEADLEAPCEAGRIEQRKEVVLDETGLIAGTSRKVSQPVLERREGTGPIGKLDQRRPEDHRKVTPRDSWPSEDQEPAQDREHHKQQVDNNNQVCKCSVDHRTPLQSHAGRIRE
jgi:hypothetical protein